MKKQLLIKKNPNELIPQIKKILELIKDINKSAVYFTHNNVILNQVSPIFGQRFFAIEIKDDSYKISTKKDEWELPDYISQKVSRIHNIVEGYKFQVVWSDEYIEYIIPLKSIVQKN